MTVKVVSFRVTEEERALLEQHAQSAGQTVSEYIRSRTLGSATTSNARYGRLADEVAALQRSHAIVENAMKLAGLDKAINQARQLLEPKEDT